VTLRVGTSGWQYRDWRGAFYPTGLATSRWLEHYAATFPTVETNSTFYRLPAPTTFERWAARTPDSFRFAVKASRYLTHVRRLRDPGPPVARLLEAAAGLGPKRGPVLVQLPPTLTADVGLLDAALGAFPAGVRVAFEPRHDSWDTDAVAGVLAAHDAARCWWDRRGAHGPLERTASWCYLRLHEGRATPAPGYGRRALRTWAERLADAWGDDADGFVYFNNDAHACAVRDAATFTRLADAVGLACAPGGAAPPTPSGATARRTTSPRPRRRR
jgi:uncharacterized protein YecE (DUF72 family)